MSRMGRYVLELQEAEEANHEYRDRKAHSDAKAHENSRATFHADGDRGLLQGSNRREQHIGSTGVETENIPLATHIDIPF